MNISSREKNKKPLLVGITGGIGSGKSTVSRIFQAKGIPVFNSDIVAKKIVNSNVEIIEKIKKIFGDVYIDNVLDSQRMANLVFGDENALKELNNIVHPKVRQAFLDWVEEHKSADVLIKEAAILIETEAYKELDKIILVVADEKTKISRVALRDKIGEDKIVQKMNNQMSDDEKRHYADFVIYNNVNDRLIPQVSKILSILQ